MIKKTLIDAHNSINKLNRYKIHGSVLIFLSGKVCLFERAKDLKKVGKQ